MDKNDFRKDLKRDLKVMKRNKVISALIYVALGVVLLAWPAETLTSVSKLISLIIAFGGAVAVVMYFINGAKGMFSYAGLAGGVIITVIGAWLFCHSEFVISLFPTIVGLMLVISGLVNLSEAFQIKKEHGEGVLMSVILAAVTILLGVVIFAFQMRFANLVTRLMGIALVYDGVSDLLIISKITGVVKTVEIAAEQAAREAAALDVTDTVREQETTAKEPASEEPKKRSLFGRGKKDKDVEVQTAPAADARVEAPVTDAPQNVATEDDFEPEEGEAPAATPTVEPIEAAEAVAEAVVETETVETPAEENPVEVSVEEQTTEEDSLL